MSGAPSVAPLSHWRTAGAALAVVLVVGVTRMGATLAVGVATGRVDPDHLDDAAPDGLRVTTAILAGETDARPPRGIRATT